MSKFVRYEGEWDSQLRQMMTKVGDKPSGVRIELATVLSNPPELTLRRDSDQLVLESAEIVVAEHLTKHKRIMTSRICEDPRFRSGYPRRFETYIRDRSDDIKSTMSHEDHMGHVHTDYMIEMDNIQNDFDMVDLEVEYQDVLRVDDRVLLACDDDNMIYYVLDRAVFY